MSSCAVEDQPNEALEVADQEITQRASYSYWGHPGVTHFGNVSGFCSVRVANLVVGQNTYLTTPIPLVTNNVGNLGALNAFLNILQDAIEAEGWCCVDVSADFEFGLDEDSGHWRFYLRQRHGYIYEHFSTNCGGLRDPSTLLVSFDTEYQSVSPTFGCGGTVSFTHNYQFYTYGSPQSMYQYEVSCSY